MRWMRGAAEQWQGFVNKLWSLSASNTSLVGAFGVWKVLEESSHRPTTKDCDCVAIVLLWSKCWSHHDGKTGWWASGEERPAYSEENCCRRRFDGWLTLSLDDLCRVWMILMIFYLLQILPQTGHQGWEYPQWMFAINGQIESLGRRQCLLAPPKFGSLIYYLVLPLIHQPHQLVLEEKAKQQW